ncbi:MAG: lactate utilization protein [Deltaproteobacteria bacterium]|nr:lactate utilization protein [Deltaproteobacteria bacterium]MBN2687396.1 lactate utilization protein [Deltaproteobacteria bacterium]
MESPVTSYWKIKMEDVKDALEANNFEAFVAQDVAEARKIVLDEIIPKTGAKTVSWGGSMTFIATGLYEALKAGTDMEALDTFDKGLSPEESLERRRQALMVDLFLTGTNAVTETGMLVNLDMYGNRVAGITFGPKTVIILVGRNKIVADLNDGLFRVKQYAGPANAMRLGKKTPCVKTANCEECNSPDRICNSWTITEKAFPKGRIKVVLINEDLGL